MGVTDCDSGPKADDVGGHSRIRTPVSTSVPAGFSLIELLVVLAVFAVLATLGLNAFTSLKSQAVRRGFAADLLADVGLARERAVSRQRAQIIYIDATGGTQKTFGYFHFEDAATPPDIYAASDLTTIMGTLTPTTPSTAPSPYVLRSLESKTSSSNVFYMSTTAWGGPLPFPFSALSQDTTGGCSFCSAGKGSLAFLPNGRVVFSNANVLGGIVAISSTRGAGGVPVSVVGISTSGFFEGLVK